MKKFLAYCSITAKNTNSFLGERLIWLFIEVFPVFIMVSFWGTLEKAGKITSVAAGQLSLYYVLGFLFSRLVSVHFEEWFINDIKDGSMSTKIIKPMAYHVFLLATEFTWRMTGMLQVIPVLIVFTPQILKIEGMQIDPAAVWLVVGFVAFSYFLRFCVSWLVSLTAFWIDQASALVHFKWMAESLFGGQWLPLSFFSVGFRSFASWTPFYTWYFVPIQLMTGEMTFSEGLTYVWRTVLWLVVLVILSASMWKSALKHYSAVGG